MQTALWWLGGWIGALRRLRPGAADYRRHEFATQTRGRGMRFGELLRDRLRLRWLRLRR